MKRFWKRKTMIDLGFKVLGLDMGNNNAYNFFIKYFPEDSVILLFDAFDNIMNLYKLSPSDYKQFEDGLFAITYDKNKHNQITPMGDKLKFLEPVGITEKTKHKKIRRNKILQRIKTQRWVARKRPKNKIEC